jgi:hypothetical protein
VPQLLGDYNRNDTVDATDYILWRKTLGTMGVPAYSGADGDGDGMIDQDDFDVWKANFGNMLPVGSGQGAVIIDRSDGQTLQAEVGEGAGSEYAAIHNLQSVTVAKAAHTSTSDIVLAAAGETQMARDDSRNSDTAPRAILMELPRAEIVSHISPSIKQVFTDASGVQLRDSALLALLSASSAFDSHDDATELITADDVCDKLAELQSEQFELSLDDWFSELADESFDL